MERDPWTQLDLDQYETLWGPFDERFEFRPGMDPSTWPAIREPSPSVTIDLSSIFAHEGPRFAAGVQAVNALALHAFTCVTGIEEELTVLDWQHPCYRFSPHRQALSSTGWPVPVFPDGDYHVFVNHDLSMGTFGHPWEQTLCVFGKPLIERLGAPLAAMLGVRRSPLKSDGDGQRVTPTPTDPGRAGFGQEPGRPDRSTAGSTNGGSAVVT